jgi:hypothetical protein
MIYDNYCIIPHPCAPRVLLMHSNAGWALPRHQQTEPTAIAAAMRERLALDLTVLRCAYDRARYEPDARSQVYEMENHAAEWAAPEHTAWIGRAALAGLRLAVPEHRAVLDAWLAERKTDPVPEQRAPWARPGWWKAATTWIRERCEDLGYSPTGPIEQVKVCAWSSVLRVATDAGAMYFKATAACADFEPAVTALLAELTPAMSPRVLAVDAERAWMQMADAGASIREEIRAARGDPSRWEEILPQFARLQMATAPAAERLVALGCPDRRLESLPAQYAALVADPGMLMVGRSGGLTEQEWASARERVGEVAQVCARLAALGIPATIQHDDLGPGNVLLAPDGRYVFFDWSDSSVAHPLLSCYIPLRWSRMLAEYDQAALDRMRDAYLEPWTMYAPLSRLRDTFPLACRLAKLSRALTWQDFVRGSEPDARWEFADAVPYFLRMFLNDDEGD